MTNYYCNCCKKPRRESGDKTPDRTNTCAACSAHITWMRGTFNRLHFDVPTSFMWNLCSLNRQIYLWHLKTFKDATDKTQRFKTNEELLEVSKEVPNSFEYFQEYADVYISACVEWMRFHSSAGKRTLLDIVTTIAQQYKGGDFFSLVSDKLLVCKNRKWVKTESGVYHHVDD